VPLRTESPAVAGYIEHMSFPRFRSIAGDLAQNLAFTRRHVRATAAAALGLILALAWFQGAPRYVESKNIQATSDNASRIAPSEQDIAPLMTGRSVAVSPAQPTAAVLPTDRKREGVGAMGFARR
jgi:hypothetical protein